NGGREAVGVVPCADPGCLSTRVGARHRIGASPIRPYDPSFVLSAALKFAPMGLAPVRDRPQGTEQQAFFDSIEASLVEEVINMPGVYLVNQRQPVRQDQERYYRPAERSQQLYPVEQIYDDHANQLGHIP